MKSKLKQSQSLIFKQFNFEWKNWIFFFNWSIINIKESYIKPTKTKHKTHVDVIALKDEEE